MTDSRLSLLNLHMSICLVGEVPFLAHAYSSVSTFLSLIPIWKKKIFILFDNNSQHSLIILTVYKIRSIEHSGAEI